MAQNEALSGAVISWGQREQERRQGDRESKRARRGAMAYKYKKRSCPDAIERAQWAKFTPCEVARHGTLEDGWCIIHGRVYDITR